MAAPMAGGVSTPELVLAAADAGALGMLAAGYKSAEQMAAEVQRVTAATELFGVNVFAPNPLPIDRGAFAAYRSELAADAAALNVELVPEPVEDDDDWAAKVDWLVANPVPLVSFTFGVPDAATVTRLRRAGSVVAQSVTSPAEARLAVAAGVDALVVQVSAAGGHSATLTPAEPVAGVALPELVGAVRGVVDVPIVAAGGVASAADVAGALAAGADLVSVGTALMLADEAGTNAPHRAALRDRAADALSAGDAAAATVVTRAFSGRPARGLRNAFTEAHADAPLGYPAIHHLTSPLRKAAAAAGDASRLHLWAGTGFAAAREAPAREILRGLGG